MAITNVFGFFYQIGSRDVPYNMNLDSKFGFNEGSNVPIFKYTLNDIQLSFNSPQKLSKDGFYNSDRMNTLIAEAAGNNELKTENISTTVWNKAFRIIEYLYNNQATFVQSADSSEYSSQGDQNLGSPQIFGTTNPNPYYVDTYVKKSLMYELSSHNGRVRYVTFQVNFTSGITTFTIYFDADAFIERTDGVRYKVYQYVDNPPEDSMITQTEFKNNIIEILFNILKEGRYNSYSDFYVDKRTGESTYITEQFFVFTSLSTPLSDSVKRIQVKQYLLERFNNDLTYLRYTYPSLFDENTVILIPAYDNKIELAGGDQLDIHPISIVKLRTILASFGFNINESNSQYRPTEIFHIGPGSGYNASNGSRPRYVYPIIAIEQDIESGVSLPISTRFQNYVPIYGSLESNNAATFHALLLAILDHLTGVSPSIDQNILTTREVVIYPPDGAHYNRKYATFKFMGTLWLIYGPASVN